MNGAIMKLAANHWKLLILVAFLPQCAANTSGNSAKLQEACDRSGAIAVVAKPIAAFFPAAGADITRFGRLEWLGGLELSASGSLAKSFGGLSDLEITESGGHMIAISDVGLWFEADIVQDALAKPVGIANAWMVCLKDYNGDYLKGKRRSDAESIALVPASKPRRFRVAFERFHRIVDYTGSDSPAKKVRLPAAITKTMSRNKGIEAMAIAPPTTRLAGATLVISERDLDGRGNIRAALLTARSYYRLTVKRIKEFDVTSAAFLANGDLLLLERHFSQFEGVSMQIRLIDGKSIAKGAVLDGEILFRAENQYEIDNMEGISVHYSRDLGAIITLISDNNFNSYQRTLLLRFRLMPKRDLRYVPGPFNGGASDPKL